MSRGNILPLTCVPFGMNAFCPQTNGQSKQWFYHPNDTRLEGIRLTHQPSPWVSDYSAMLFGAQCGELNGHPAFYSGLYDRGNASLRPDYIRVGWHRYQAQMELTPTERCACFRVTYEADATPYFCISTPGRMEILCDPEERTACGAVRMAESCEDPNFRMYFVLAFEEALDGEKTEVFTPAFHRPALEGAGDGLGLAVAFQTPGVKVIRVATSYISLEQARRNLQGEAGSKSFEALRADAAARWEALLGKIEVETAEGALKRTFYSCLHKMFIYPRKFYELDAQGQPQHYDTRSRTVRPGVAYTDNGFWDTHKTVYPLFSLLIPEQYEEMMQGFLNFYEETGYLPKWLSPDERGYMPGTLIDAVLADAFVKGIGLDLMPQAAEAMRKHANQAAEDCRYGRKGIEDYVRYGYIPYDEQNETVSATQDYAFGDFCLSRILRLLGRDEEAAEYETRSLNYRRLVDPETGFMRARSREGNFREPFDPLAWGQDYCEGGPWQDSWAVYHDIRGLADALGGAEVLNKKMIELFDTPPIFHTGGYHLEIHEMSEMVMVNFGQCALSNQPSFHVPYIFSAVGHPESTQYITRRLMRDLFTDALFPGDEDNGSMAGWYVFSAMGFYPFCPASGEYTLGSPLFDKVTLHLANGKNLVIRAADNQEKNVFVRSMERDGQPYTHLYLKHDDLMRGGDFLFRMSCVPQAGRCTEEDLPYSLSRG